MPERALTARTIKSLFVRQSAKAEAALSERFKTRRHDWRVGLLAIGLAIVPLAAGGGVLYFLITISPVHPAAEAVPSSATDAPAAAWSGAIENGRGLARAMTQAENLPAVSVAVAVDGRIVWAEAFGWADVERRVPATPLTTFRIGAVSQVLTAAAAGVLADRGLLDLDAPVQLYVPAFPEKQWPTTTRQLLGHIGGVRDFPDEHESLSTDHCGTTAEAMEPFAADPLLFRPGTEFRHSAYGYVLVSAAIEAAAGAPFFLFMQREVFEPLGMNDTGPDPAADDVAGRASFYFPRFMARTSLGLHPTRPVDYSCFSGAGAFLSTPSDLARFGSALMRGGLLRAETAATLQAPLRLESGEFTGRALGWKPETVTLHGAPARLVGRASNPFGGTASLLMFPDQGLVIAITSNVSYARGVAPFGLQLAELFAPARQPKQPD